MTAQEEHDRPAAPDPALLQRWNATLRAARAGHEGPDPAPYGRNLLARWAEPQRRYHTVDHLRAVLDRIDELADQGGEGGELELVRLAAWFHDAVYRPDRSENEERSAVLAEKALAEAGLTPHEVAEVARLVRLTITHDPAPGDLNGETLCDADLAILATGPDTYGGYTAAVREEYGFVPDDAFREGRAAVLRHLLDLPRLFRTPYGAAVWEERARENLERELAELTSAPKAD
ncbi:MULTISPECIES: HD domain-containing protein [unclassified Streptomyces]|uniref:HD domain-containing protein n=1 Tax=unclassified Streptomyces TaxID=2593676 RepID=UPI003681F23B